MMQSELRRMRLARLRAIAWQGQEAIERERACPLRKAAGPRPKNPLRFVLDCPKS